jgi:hypothetical protein
MTLFASVKSLAARRNEKSEVEIKMGAWGWELGKFQYFVKEGIGEGSGKSRRAEARREIGLF